MFINIHSYSKRKIETVVDNKYKSYNKCKLNEKKKKLNDFNYYKNKNIYFFLNKFSSSIS
jgi:hypothetical protein